MSQFTTPSITEPALWRFHRLGLLLVGIGMMFLSGCTRVAEDTYKGYAGDTLTDADIAIIRNTLPNRWNSLLFQEAPYFEVDGVQLGKHPQEGKRYTRVQLAPGKHTVKYNVVFNVSTMIESSGHASFLGTAENIDLKAGHTYALRANRTIGPGYRVRMLIWDETEDQDAFPDIVKVTREK